MSISDIIDSKIELCINDLGYILVAQNIDTYIEKT